MTIDLESIKIHIQDFFDENTLTIVGSGLSVAEGLPSMSDLAQKLIEEMPKIIESTDKLKWTEIENLLKQDFDLESTLQLIFPNASIEEKMKQITSDFIREKEKQVLSSIINKNKILKFYDYITRFNLANNYINIITTNYDRLIEYACECNNIRVDTLFVGQFMSYFSPEESKYTFCKGINNRRKRPIYSPHIRLFKPHGSLSWYKINENIYSIPQHNGNDCLIITPGSNKYEKGYNCPFDTHREKANKAIDEATKYVIIGYGFNDSHLEQHLIVQLKQKPSLVLTYSLTENAKKILAQSEKMMAITYDKVDSKSGSRITTYNENYFIPDINLWDIQELVKELF